MLPVAEVAVQCGPVMGRGMRIFGFDGGGLLGQGIRTAVTGDAFRHGDLFRLPGFAVTTHTVDSLEVVDMATGNLADEAHFPTLGMTGHASLPAHGLCSGMVARQDFFFPVAGTAIPRLCVWQQFRRCPGNLAQEDQTEPQGKTKNKTGDPGGVCFGIHV